MPYCFLLLKEDRRFVEVGVDFRRFLGRFTSQSRIKSEFRPDCSGLFPGLANQQRWKCLNFTVKFAPDCPDCPHDFSPSHTEQYFFQLQFQFNKSLVPLIAPVWRGQLHLLSDLSVGAEGCCQFPLTSPLLWAEQVQLPQPLLTGQMFQHPMR